MPMYRVDLAQKVWEEATVFVEAASPDQAERRALRRVSQGKVEWSFLEAPDTPEVLACKEISPNEVHGWGIW